MSSQNKISYKAMTSSHQLSKFIKKEDKEVEKEEE